MYRDCENHLLIARIIILWRGDRYYDDSIWLDSTFKWHKIGSAAQKLRFEITSSREYKTWLTFLCQNFLNKQKNNEDISSINNNNNNLGFVNDVLNGEHGLVGPFRIYKKRCWSAINLYFWLGGLKSIIL